MCLVFGLAPSVRDGARRIAGEANWERRSLPSKVTKLPPGEKDGPLKINTTFENGPIQLPACPQSLPPSLHPVGLPLKAAICSMDPTTAKFYLHLRVDYNLLNSYIQ